ncbi:UNVERIFIED_CONTAM: ABC transporter G family member 25 [Sesamum radiatum]|uniref:ABC transporter G family member 25 n=1 Tax=Sesamum radiatum TaxID=300843 RepID=A0AAW2M5D8_SESRA
MLVSGEAAEASPNGGEQYSKHYLPRDPNFHSSSSSSPITLKFLDVSYRVKLHDTTAKSRTTTIRNMFGGSPTPSSDVENPPSAVHRHQERTILNGITGMAAPGQILAILGPSGSGKSTLLNALAGRLHHGHGLTGAVLFNNRKLTKHVLKRTGFVAQDDVLYPHLTVQETLVFCSLLRLPSSMPKNEKIAVAESVISELGLSKCKDTIIGNSFIRGVSGGERKRTRGDAGGLAAKGKTVVTSVHQPSSRVYQMFDGLLVLSEGRCIYFGKGSEAMGYFESVGFSPSFPMNPADFLLDLANGMLSLSYQLLEVKKYAFNAV